MVCCWLQQRSVTFFLNFAPLKQVTGIGVLWKPILRLIILSESRMLICCKGKELRASILLVINLRHDWDNVLNVLTQEYISLRILLGWVRCHLLTWCFKRFVWSCTGLSDARIYWIAVIRNTTLWCHSSLLPWIFWLNSWRNTSLLVHEDLRKSLFSSPTQRKIAVYMIFSLNLWVV